MLEVLEGVLKVGFLLVLVRKGGLCGRRLMEICGR